MGDSGHIWPDGCGSGRWCPQCRDEIREEAILWLRQLNVLPSERLEQVAVTMTYHPWHKQWQLGTAVDGPAPGPAA